MSVHHFTAIGTQLIYNKGKILQNNKAETETRTFQDIHIHTRYILQ